MLRQAKKSDINSLASIHYFELHSDFLASLGQKFLRLLYLNLIQSKKTYILVYESDGKVQGFIVGARGFSNNFKEIIFKNFIQFVILIFPEILKNPKALKNVLETFFYTRKQGHNSLSTELVVIAVSKKFHRKGIGKKLIYSLENKFAEENINEYKVSVNKKNKNANMFYKSFDFIKYNEFMLYGKKINLYIKKIK